MPEPEVEKLLQAQAADAHGVQAGSSGRRGEEAEVFWFSTEALTMKGEGQERLAVWRDNIIHIT